MESTPSELLGLGAAFFYWGYRHTVYELGLGMRGGMLLLSCQANPEGGAEEVATIQSGEVLAGGR